jgi:hypothetical protein
MKTIHLARGLTLPAADLATEVVASLGQRGSGKSNGAAVVAEGLLAAGIQVIVLDHVGIWFSLRLDATGKHPSPYRIPVLGGQHGDIALVATTGAVVAEALARSGSSAVLDVSSFSKGDRCRFAADFAEAFFAAKKLHPGPVQILLEEAQRYVPQKLYSGQGLERMLGAFEEIAEVGRNYGVGLHLISQRPQKINKDVLNLADTVLAYRANGVLERKAISEWVQEKGAEGRKEMHDELPGLPRGTAIVWSPNRAIYSRYAIGLKATYDAGATPTHARAAVKTKRLDLDQLEEAMGAAVEQAKANDPRALKARIVELERHVAAAPSAQALAVLRDVHAWTKDGPLHLDEEDRKKLRGVLEGGTAKASTKAPRIVHESVLEKADLQRLERSVEKAAKGVAALDGVIALIEHHRDRLAQSQQVVASSMSNLSAVLGKAKNGVPERAPPVVISTPGSPRRQALAKAFLGGTPPPSDSDTDLPKYALDLLNVVAQRGKASDVQISALSGYRRTSSAFGKMLGKLAAAGLITGEPRERTITEAGRERAGAVEALPTGQALLDHWLARLTGYEALFLKTIHEAGTITREDLSARTNRSMNSSAFGKTIGALQRLALVDGPRGGDLTIAESFFT